jgi:hypothetical protein
LLALAYVGNEYEAEHFLLPDEHLPIVKLPLTGYLLKRLLEQCRLIRRRGGYGNHAAHYTESGNETRRKKQRRPVTPRIEPFSNQLSASLAQCLPEWREVDPGPGDQRLTMLAA